MSASSLDASQLIIALDVPSGEEAIALAEQLAPLGVGFKVGMQLFYAEGIGIVNEIQSLQETANPVFVDLKLHDIPNTVAKAAESLITQGVGFFNVHCTGGKAMMKAAVEAARNRAQQLRQPKPTVIGVTVLTSWDADTFQQELKIASSTQGYAVHLAQLAQEAGLDGVVCSGQEAEKIRQVCGKEFLLVTPGIRPADSALNDQARILTPQAALAQGANRLVVGRPVTSAKNPVTAAQAILSEMCLAV